MVRDKRERFLLRMYGEYWDNISRAEDSAWKIFASYTALFAGLSIAYPVLGDAGFLVVLLLFSFMAMAVALRSNLWYVRNLGLISNIEQEFLEKKDYGTIVPCFFLKKTAFLNDEIWWIHFLAYSSIASGVTVFMYPRLDIVERQWIMILLIVFLVLCFAHVFFLYIQYKEFRSQAPGKYSSKEYPRSV